MINFLFVYVAWWTPRNLFPDPHNNNIHDTFLLEWGSRWCGRKKEDKVRQAKIVIYQRKIMLKEKTLKGVMKHKANNVKLLIYEQPSLKTSHWSNWQWEHKTSADDTEKSFEDETENWNFHLNNKNSKRKMPIDMRVQSHPRNMRSYVSARKKSEWKENTE